MQQPQQQISTGGQGAQPEGSKDTTTAGAGGAFPSGSADLNSIFLNALPKDTTEEKLRKVLADLAVQPTQVKMNIYNGETRAFLSFSDFESMCKAAAIIDKSTIEGTAFKRANNRKAEFNEVTSVFIKNLPQDVGNDELFAELQKVGNVVNCQVLKDHNLQSKSLGVVNFITKEQAQNAIAQLNDKPFPGKEGGARLSINFYRDREQDRVQRGTGGGVQKTNLYVSGLPSGISEQQVREMFAEFGDVRSVLLKSPVAPQTEAAKQFTQLLPIYSMAYVNFDSEESAQNAFVINTRDPMSQIKVAYYDKQQMSTMQLMQNQQSADVRGNTYYRILFISKLNRRVTQSQLQEICKKFGAVQSCKLSMGFDRAGNQISLGKAVVAYATREEANTAMQKLYFESDLGDYIQVDFFKSRELRMEQEAQNSEFTRMLTQYSQRYQNQQPGGYGRGSRGFHGQGGYQGGGGGRGNYRQGGAGNVAGAQGGPRYQQQQQNSQYQPRGNRNNNQQTQQMGSQGQYQGARPHYGQQNAGGNPGQGQQQNTYGGGRQGGRNTAPRGQYRNNQSQQYPNQRRQYNNRRNQNQHQSQGQQPFAPDQNQPASAQQQQRPIMDQASFPTLGGQPGAQSMPVMPMAQQPMPAQVAMPPPAQPQTQPAAQQQQQSSALTAEMVGSVGDATAQKQYLGEALYAKVVQVDGPRAGQIVGMILDAFPMESIIENVNNGTVLTQTIQKAQQTIEDAQRAQATQPAATAS